MEQVAEICHSGFGEVEVHLHHDNDTEERLRRTLINYKKMLSEEYGLLSVSRTNHEIRYGFIHGDWALDNSHPSGSFCGVNNEITVLQETGCYADFTMPSAPSETQTSTVNSIYYADDEPDRPKSHDTGNPAIAGLVGQKGLLCIQGPLGFNFTSRKWGLLPRIENGAISADARTSEDRVRRWIRQHIHLKGRPDVIFIKVYMHGTQEAEIDYLFKRGGFDSIFSTLGKVCSDGDKYRLYYVTPRQMFNVIKGLEAEPGAEVKNLFDYELVSQVSASQANRCL
jgi:hypothetical protein